jgi:hypothetical protein
MKKNVFILVMIAFGISAKAQYDMLIHWLPNDETQVTSYGFNSTQTMTFTAYMEFNLNDLSNYKSTTRSLDTIKQIQFCIDASYRSSISACNVIIRQGNDISTATNMVVQAVQIGNLVGNWNYVNLSSPYIIDHAKKLFIGYQLSFTAGYPFPVASGNNSKQGWIHDNDGFNNISSSNQYVFLIKAIASSVVPPPANEIELISLTVQQNNILGDTLLIQGRIKNLGSNPLTSFFLTYVLNNILSAIDTVSGINIAYNGEYNFTCKHFLDSVFSDKIVVRVFNPNGATDMELNNTKEATVNVYSQVLHRVVLHEVFTSSTCPPCNPGNQQLKYVLNQINDNTKWACIKYQYGFPGDGDPYYTSEGSARGSFYGGISGVPTLVVDGTYECNPNSYSVSAFNNMEKVHAMVTLTGIATIKNKTIGLNVSVNPATNMNNSNLRFFAAIVEKKTFNNTATNGETEFQYVMKKFMTNINGDVLAPLTVNNPISLPHYSYTFNGNYRLPANARSPINHSIEHSVENFNNLMVVYWLQDISTKEVFQAGNVDVMPACFVSLSTADSNMGTVPGSGDYAINKTAIIEAIPKVGYRFVEWNDGNTDNPRTITVTQDTSFSANFEALIQVKIAVNDSVMGTVTGVGYYIKDSTAILEAIPYVGYRFVQWDDGNTDNPRIISVTSDTLFTAEFERMILATVYTNNPLMGSVTGNGIYIKDSTIIITATPDANFRFLYWNDGDMQNPRNVTLTQDTVFIAIFSIEVQGMYHVTVLANKPNMGIVMGNGDYIENDMITIGVIENQGYSFMQWSDGNTQNPRLIKVTQDTIFTAIFKETYHVSVLANNALMGIVTGNGYYERDSIVIIGAIAHQGYLFRQWNDGNMDNPRTITVTQDITYTAIFALSTEKIYLVSVDANNPNMGIVTGSGNYAENTAVTLTATANPGYRFLRWNDDTTSNPRMITITQDTAFTAIFSIASQGMYNMSVLANNETRGTVMGSGDYAENSEVPIGAIANTGYRFVCWHDGIPDNPRTITVIQDTIFIASFEPIVGITYTETENSNISVYPNPATDNITVILPSNISTATFTLYDMQGRILIKQNINNQDAISVSNLAAGIYIYNVTTDKQKHGGKLIINN